MVQIAEGESSEIFCPSLVGGRDPVNKWMRAGGLNRALSIMLRNIAERVTFWIDLWQNVLNMCLGKHESVPTGSLKYACAGIPWACPTSGNTYAGFYGQESH
jgi:hypothetical protein